MDHSLNSARQSLRVGKIRLYNYLDELGIEPTLNGNSKLITDKQLEEIRTAIQAEALSQQNPEDNLQNRTKSCLLYTSPSPRDLSTSRMPSSA